MDGATQAPLYSKTLNKYTNITNKWRLQSEKKDQGIINKKDLTVWKKFYLYFIDDNMSICRLLHYSLLSITCCLKIKILKISFRFSPFQLPLSWIGQPLFLSETIAMIPKCNPWHLLFSNLFSLLQSE